jgi:hypothetical protein
MSQLGVPWTNAATDPFVPSIEEDYITQAKVDEAFRQSAPNHPIFPLAHNNDLDEIDLTIENGLFSQAESSNPSTVSTPSFSTYNFGDQSFFYTQSGANTHFPVSLEYEQAHQAYAHSTFHQRPLASREHSNPSFTVASQLPQCHDRRRSLSHSDVDRIAAAPLHPTFVRLQGSQVPRAGSATVESKKGPGLHHRYSRSASQGPSYLGRPLENTVSYTLPEVSYARDMLSAPVGTHIGTPIRISFDERGSRKRSRYPDNDDHATQYGYGDPYIRHTTDPVHLEHSRRIIEIGAMAVRSHTKLDPRLEEIDGMGAQERILKKVKDVERYLKQDRVHNEEALKGCAMIREALNRKADKKDVAIKIEHDNASADQDPSDVPSNLMPTEHSGLFGGALDENDLMSLLMRENEKLDCDKADV